MSCHTQENQDMKTVKIRHPGCAFSKRDPISPLSSSSMYHRLCVFMEARLKRMFCRAVVCLRQAQRQAAGWQDVRTPGRLFQRSRREMLRDMPHVTLSSCRAASSLPLQPYLKNEDAPRD
ncbi:hypothetical protein COCON_G00162250 [Conger conger]|uniref:Uncharacterized protein n=1 Tax=Conger conger TaxID=82655 RepID=A0A9Q1D632_CONCO|nr:hypothetical protein COCON_G00162250 [Conger conger]